MARNFKKDYIKKIMQMEAPNGYKFDILNYLHNPGSAYDYPSFRKVIAEDESEITERMVYYFKYWDGTGAYKEEISTIKKDEISESGWVVQRNAKDKVIERSNRFNIKKLLEFC